MSTPGNAVVAKAEQYCCRFYETYGSNRGPEIDRWSAVWGWPHGGQPWCGIGESGIIRDAGQWSEYGGAKLLSPSTDAICANARRLGWVWSQDDGKIPPGSLWVHCGVHTEIIIEDIAPAGGTVHTIGCNVSGGIYRKIRSAYGNTVVVPPSIKVPPFVWETYYWLEDTLAKPYLVGKWRSKANRDKELNKLLLKPFWRAQHARPGHSGKSYTIIAGGLRHYGPWDTVAARGKVRPLIEKRVGHILRTYSTKKKIPNPEA